MFIVLSTVFKYSWIIEERFASQQLSIFNPKKNQVELTGSSIIFIKGTNYLVKNLRDSLFNLVYRKNYLVNKVSYKLNNMETTHV